MKSDTSHLVVSLMYNSFSTDRTAPKFQLPYASWILQATCWEVLFYHRGRVSGDCGPQRVGGMSNCAVTRRRLREKHVENPSTDSPVKDLTNVQLNIFLVCATGAFKQKTRTHRQGDVTQHHNTATHNLHTANLYIH